MVAYTTRMATGFPGAVSRFDSATITPEFANSSLPPTAYGQFVKNASGTITPFASGDAASVIVGITVRPYVVQSTTNAAGAATPPATGTIDMMRRGFMSVALKQGTSAKFGQVYVRTTAASGKFVGDIETAADSGNCVAVVGAFFNGAAGADGVVEIAYNI